MITIGAFINGGQGLGALNHRFWSKVDRRSPNDCWPWLGAQKPTGYGLFSLNGSQVHAHRLAFLLDGGEIPDDENVLHHCDTPPCCNPKHLWTGTQEENMKDMIEKGHDRKHVGGKSRLLDASIIAIRRLVAAGQQTNAEIAVQFSVLPMTISNIASGKSWRKVGGPLTIRGNGRPVVT